MNNLTALVVDDTIVYRKIVGDILKKIPGIEVVGTANNGKIALSKIKTLQPDLITLDIEMPEMTGIEVLQQLQGRTTAPKVIMVSTLTRDGSEMTIKALELGAFDFIPKPEEGTMAQNLARVKEALTPIITTIKSQKDIARNIRGKITHRQALRSQTRRTRTAPELQPRSESATYAPARRRIRSTSEIVGIGISTGGPNALTKMVPMLPADFKAPILIVQHMPPMFTASLANSLNNKSPLTVKEAQDGDILAAGTVYIAPGGKQMKIVAGSDGISRKIKITDDPPENSCKPSVDYLFRSIAQYYVGRSTAVIMTGMGSDGSKGLIRIKENGGIIIAQDEASCTVFGMPKQPIETGLADVIAPLNMIAGEIVKTVI
ncbi:MAG: chemotaxis response regulator protein-glutamate methylesterase [Desulfotignum sp.]|nr:chemotaxis response regulator protein-glutamate methylesterase [Desulfobacteraceae bacterium]